MMSAQGSRTITLQLMDALRSQLDHLANASAADGRLASILTTALSLQGVCEKQALADGALSDVLRAVVQLVRPAAGAPRDDESAASAAATADSDSPAEDAVFRAATTRQRVPRHFLPYYGGARTLLLCGPPGTGKTRAVQRACTRADIRLVTVTAGDIMTRWVGSAEARLRRGFRWAADHAPSVLFFDEIDALFSRRGGDGESEAARRVKTELLCLMQSVLDRPASAPLVMLIAATNLPWDLDAALVRRFQDRVFCGLPTPTETRRIIAERLPAAVRIHTAAEAPLCDEGSDGNPPGPLGFDDDCVVESFDGCTHAEVANACDAVLRSAIEERLRAFESGCVSALGDGEQCVTASALVARAKLQHRSSSREDLIKFAAWGGR